MKSNYFNSKVLVLVIVIMVIIGVILFITLKIHKFKSDSKFDVTSNENDILGEYVDITNSKGGNENNSKAQILSEKFILNTVKFNYLLYVPENKKSNMPLIVYLHGGTGKGDNIDNIYYASIPKYLQDGSLRDVSAYLLMPQLPSDKKSWADIADSIRALILKICNDYRIDSKKISLTGHSMGGTGTYEIAIKYPELFSYIVPISGSIKNNEYNLDKLKGLFVWAFVSSSDTIVKPEFSINYINSLKSFNKNAKITIIDEMTHFDMPSVYLNESYNVINWMLSCIKE